MSQMINMVLAIGLLLAHLAFCLADYPCVCNYNVESKLFLSFDVSSKPFAYLYEFDCAEQVNIPLKDDTFYALAYRHKICYIKRDSSVVVQLCQGSPPAEHHVVMPLSTSGTTTTMMTTITTDDYNTKPSTTDSTTRPHTSFIITDTTTPLQNSTTSQMLSFLINATTTSLTTTQASLNYTSTKLYSTSAFNSSLLDNLTSIPFTSPHTSPPLSSSTSKLTSTTVSKTTLPTTSLSSTTSTTLPTTSTTTTSSTNLPTTSSTRTTPLTTSKTTSTSTKTSSTTKSTEIPTTVKSFDHGNINLCPIHVRQSSFTYGTSLAQYGEYCYELFTKQQVTWPHGEAVCNEGHGHLAYIVNAGQQAFVQSFIQQHLAESLVWIGLHDSAYEKFFQWTSGAHIKYANLIPGYTENHDQHNEEDCFAILSDTGKWDDFPCGQPFPFEADAQKHNMICQFHTVTPPGLVG